MLRLEKVSYTYPTGTVALKNVEVEFPEKQILGILGESGSGKTTLLKCIGKFLKPQRGRITLDGRDIAEIDEVEMRRAVGIVFQELFLFPHLTVLGNMTLALRKVLKQEKIRAEEEARAMLGRLGIGHLEESFPSQISRGQAQRAAIARALILKPKYLLLDEPTSALDINTADEFGRWLVELKQYTTFVIVTHDIRFAGKVVTSGVVFSRGEVRLEGGIEDLVHDIETMPDVWEGN